MLTLICLEVVRDGPRRVCVTGKVLYSYARLRVILRPEDSQWRIHYHCLCGQLSTTCSNATEEAHGQLPVSVNHRQRWTMASETVDPIHWPLLPALHRAVPSEIHLLSANAATNHKTCLIISQETIR